MQARLGWVLTFIFMLMWVIPGCAGSDVAHSSLRNEWVDRHGGIASAGEQARLDRCADRIIPAERRLIVHTQVLGSSEAGAFAWRDGRIFVTSGLIRLMDDDELCAAIAHELGHLSAGASDVGQVNSLVARGDIESDADRAGAVFLKNASINPHVLIEMLTKLRGAPELSPAVRSGIERRIAILASDLPNSAPLLKK